MVPPSPPASTSPPVEWNFGYTGSVAYWTVPHNGTYRVTLAGASGGGANTTYTGTGGMAGGRGISGLTYLGLIAGQQLAIVVGGKGCDAPPGVNANNVPYGGAGGGGATFIGNISANTLLAAAGGGGGVGWPEAGTDGSSNSGESAGSPGSAGMDNGDPAYPASDGSCAGDGGHAGGPLGAPGGAGGGGGAFCAATDKRSFLGGSTALSLTKVGAACGGFGGGGSGGFPDVTAASGGGGGGGVSGGNGGNAYGTGGKGGTSYNLVAPVDSYNSGDGFVRILAMTTTG
jgi:hypothetical protein